ncbi:hypothetical protein VNI00_000611 [Paramarasmius palmivorus]|uniref:F-box domain-containing protein n=1 Tax=Paramarasmius palmivorus TaxID=297713 RepID=A0AAW0E8B1_9AGAR
MEIFLYAALGVAIPNTDTLHIHNPPSIDSTRQIIHQLSLVCHRWRNLILATPYLWSFISFNVGYGDNTRILQLSLNRASERSLNVEITDSTSTIYGESDLSERSLDAYRVLLETCTRWKSLRFSILSPSDILNNAPEGIKPQFPLLESLSFDSMVDLDRITFPKDDEHWLLSALLDAPRLTRLVIINPRLLNAVPCHQLTSLEIHRLCGTSERVLQILQACQGLRYLTLNSWFAQSGSLPRAQELKHGNLRHLSISMRGAVHIGTVSLFDSLVLPSLVVLRVVYEPRELNLFWPPQTLIRLIKRSSCILQTLALYVNVTCMLNAFMEALLPEIPTLLYLDITFIAEDRHDELERAIVGLLWQLAVRPSKRSSPSRVAPLLLPKLLEIRIQHSCNRWGVITATKDGLKHLARSRNRANIVALECLGDVLPLVSASHTVWGPPRADYIKRDLVLNMISDSG